MKNNYTEFKQLSYNDLLKEFEGLINKLYKEYSFLGVDESFFNKIIADELQA